MRHDEQDETVAGEANELIRLKRAVASPEKFEKIPGSLVRVKDDVDRICLANGQKGCTPIELARIFESIGYQSFSRFASGES